MKKPNEFQEKLLLSVIDKLVFGLLIVLAGFVLNRTLEDYRSEQATSAEIARLRVARVANVWTALNKQQAQIDRMAPSAAFWGELTFRWASTGEWRLRRGEARKFLRLSKNARDAIASFERREPAITVMLRDNRFWIGEALYPHYFEYSKRQRALVHAYQGISWRFYYSPRTSDPVAHAPSSKRRLRACRHGDNNLLTLAPTLLT